MRRTASSSFVSFVERDWTFSLPFFPQDPNSPRTILEIFNMECLGISWNVKCFVGLEGSPVVLMPYQLPVAIIKRTDYTAILIVIIIVVIMTTIIITIIYIYILSLYSRCRHGPDMPKTAIPSDRVRTFWPYRSRPLASPDDPPPSGLQEREATSVEQHARESLRIARTARRSERAEDDWSTARTVSFSSWGHVVLIFGAV